MPTIFLCAVESTPTGRAAFASSRLPAGGSSRHGSVLGGIMHNADWWPTLSNHLAGASLDDPPGPNVTGVPDVDGYDMWPYTTGEVAASPRSEVVLDSTPNGGIISDDLKRTQRGPQTARCLTAGKGASSTSPWIHPIITTLRRRALQCRPVSGAFQCLDGHRVPPAAQPAGHRGVRGPCHGPPRLPRAVCVLHITVWPQVKTGV
jgi:hypothetical protein